MNANLSLQNDEVRGLNRVLLLAMSRGLIDKWHFERDLLLPFYSDNTFVKKISGSPLVELRIGKGAIIAGEMMIEAPLDPICRSENAPKAMYRSYSSCRLGIWAWPRRIARRQFVDAYNQWVLPIGIVIVLG
jgi:hypothetical protein